MSHNKQNLVELFESIAQPNEKGYSREVSMEELVLIDERFKNGNGGAWCRSDGALEKKYNIIRIKSGGKIIAIKLDGFNKEQKIKRSINKSISEKIKKQRCIVLDIGNNIECDHKNGQYNDFHMNDTKN